MKIEVAGIVIKLAIPDHFLREDIYKFRCDESLAPEVVIEAGFEPFPAFPEFAGKTPPVHHVCLSGPWKYYLFSSDDSVSFIQYDHEYSHFIINMAENGNEREAFDFFEAFEPFIEAVNSAMRRVFVMLLAARGGVSLHSSTVGLDGAAICFSAGSGTGKTTHTGLWRKHIPGAEIYNGDNCYLFAHDGAAWFYSAPWCGTSGDLMNRKAPVKAVIFLAQAHKNAMRRLAVPDAFVRLLAGCFLPAWDKEAYVMALDAVAELAGMIDCRHLECRPDEEAMRMVFDGIYQ
jgi:hypothetical protein